MHKADRSRAVTSQKQHRLAFAQPCEQKAARRFQVRRLLVKLPVGIEQGRDLAHVGWRGLHNFQRLCWGTHGDKETRRRLAVNSFVARLPAMIVEKQCRSAALKGPAFRRAVNCATTPRL